MVDPISLEVFKNLFTSVCEEMGVALQRTAYSPNIKERRDYSCAVFDAEGDLLAQAAAQGLAQEGQEERADDKRIIVASKSYIEENGAPQTPADLKNHKIVNRKSKRPFSPQIRVEPTVLHIAYQST